MGNTPPRNSCGDHGFWDSPQIMLTVYNRMQPTFQHFSQVGRGAEANPYCRRICVQKQKHKYTNTKALWVCLRPSPQLRKTLKGWLHSIIVFHTANDPLSAGSSKHDFDTAVRVYMMIEAYHEVIMSQLLIIRV